MRLSIVPQYFHKPISCDIPIGDVVEEIVDIVASKSKRQCAYNIQRHLLLFFTFKHETLVYIDTSLVHSVSPTRRHTTTTIY